MLLIAHPTFFSVNRPKLVYIINSIDYGGAEIGMIRLLSELEPTEFDVTIVTLQRSVPDLISKLPDHVSVHELGIDSKIELHKLIPLRKIISKSDILVCSLFHSVVAGSIIGSTLFRSPKIYSWRHNTDSVQGLRKLLYSISYYLSDGILVDSESTKELVLNWGINERRISVLPLAGVDIDEYPSVNDYTSKGRIRIGTVARLLEQKGYPELIKCAEKLPDYEFHIIGDGPLSEMIQQSPDNVISHGRVSDDKLRRLWGTFDIYFQPSRYEGLCITAIEAMASGLPVVASNVDGLSESIVDGKTGYLVKQGDIEAYCSRIQELASSPEMRRKFGEAAKNRAHERYSSEALANQFRNVIC